METAHRRVELQSPADLTYLVANVKRAARQKIDLHLPPSAAPEGGEDVLRRKVEELVDEYIRNTFASARHGISINGMSPEDLPQEQEDTQEYEPYNTHIATRIRTLEAQKDSLTEKLADLRRDGPSRAADAWATRFDAQTASQQARQLEAKDAALAAAAADARLLEQAELWPLQGEAGDEVRAMWERGTEGLVALKRGLTETVARVERANGVVGYVEGREDGSRAGR
ncbi:uncharacterized protein J3D65DRAFT_75962 [Phyllosticta citribraziliensis]|uniref:Kinetochore protein mis14 n=1 Tax=Phyllosticta citribraziliensis TaxID=989973 RepID=A0ABR1LDC1_9PEZI